MTFSLLNGTFATVSGTCLMMTLRAVKPPITAESEVAIPEGM